MLIYNLVILMYGFIIRLAAVNKLKAKQWIAGRDNWRENYTKKISALSSQENIWVHCASYGEFEQGRPLLEAIKMQHPRYKIILTFFSPSGYEPFKDWGGADAVFYLPLDTKENARDFIEIVKPKVAIFIKYEFWLNFLFELKKQNIATYLVSAVFKPHHPFFKWYGGVFRRSLKTFNTLFVQDKNSGKFLTDIEIINYQVCGDTRFDRVMEVKKNFSPLPYFEQFCAGSRIIVAGSTWPKDDEFLLDAFKKIKTPNVKLILVPHEVNEKSIGALVSLVVKKEQTASLYSNQNPASDKNVLIVDAVGLLSRIYHYADISYIGGGFDEGIHNCLEPAVYFKPVIFFGEGFEKYNEATELIQMKVAVNVLTVDGTVKTIEDFLNGDKKSLENILENYFLKNSGTTKKVLQTMNLN